MTGTPIGRIVEIAENGRHLAKDRGFLTVSADGEQIGRVPLDDVAAVLATAPGTTVSCVLLAELAARGVSFTVCGRNFAPAALLWPTDGHHEQQRRMEAQLAAPQNLKARLWALLVAAKIARQGMVLKALGKRAGAFEHLATMVTSGDTANLEAQAARRYWPLLLGKEFRRDPALPGINGLLNYGYTVLRAGVARSIAGAGLHPGIGLFHRHPRNPMPLADDVMEPFRPDVDFRVAELVAGGVLEVSTEAKRRLVEVLSLPVAMSIGYSPLATSILRLTQSLSAAFVAGKAELALPLPVHVPDDAMAATSHETV